MFARIMAVVLAVILLLTGVLSVVGLVTLQGRETEQVQEELRKEAREIAYLAAQRRSMGLGLFGSPSEEQRYLQWKAARVYEEFGAYILVVDRSGRMMDNMHTAYVGNPDFAGTLDRQEILQALGQVLQGEEIEWHVNKDGADFFTVGVPFVQSGYVLGAVFMQTPAQAIRTGAGELLGPVAAIATAACLLAGLVLFVSLRRMLRPLRRLTQAARTMAEGDFSIRVEDAAATQEVADLSSAFNTMADQLSMVESGRREFVANVSHELRSPITAIRGYVEGMLDGVIPPEEQQRYLGTVRDETQRLSRLIDELLSLSRLEREDAALNLTEFDMCDLLERVFLRRVDEMERRGMDIDCDFDPEPCVVQADRGRMEQVVVNLLDNAMKFTPDGGRIVLRVRAADGLCTVTVEDNGPGVPPEDRERVFERFFTADRAHTSGKGTGLGLSICQRIMEMHGQSIRLLETAQGAAFAFTLPVADVRSVNAQPDADN